jgi:cytochrome c peroxidase
MKNNLFILSLTALFFLSLSSSFAVNKTESDIDERLQGYIQKFNLKPLDRPTGMRRDLLDLGHELFTTRLLSGNNNISCKDCHFPGNMTVDGLPLGLGEGAIGMQSATTRRVQGSGKILARNSQALFNLNGINVMFWDGRVSFDPATGAHSTPVAELNGLHPARSDVARTLKSALATQAIFPIADHAEMRGQPGSNAVADAATTVEAWDLVVAKLMNDNKFKATFEKVFPGERINIGHVGEALAEFQRFAFAYSDTAYDRYLKGDLSALNEVQKIGMDVFFNKGKCGECHQGQHLSNFEFHNVGVAQIGPGNNNGDDFGRHQWDQRTGNLYAFRVPALRNVALTGPYMHNGMIKTLPQVVEHYDMIVESLTGFRLINNWKNYVESITDHDHRNDDIRVASLSTKLTPKLNFEEEEEKALTEFLATGLTDSAFLNREIDGDYRTYFRLQLRESGYEKLLALFPGKAERHNYYYFDVIFEGGFGLKGLSKPLRLIAVKKPYETELVFREQAFKTATATDGIVLESNFNRTELKTVPEAIFNPLETAYLDMFRRIYNYNDGEKNEDIPTAELTIIKNDVDAINAIFHKIEFDGADIISDQLNSAKEDVYYVPTSYNEKDVLLFTLQIAGKTVKGNLQKSWIRTDKGGMQVTWALELETSKVTKAQHNDFAQEILKALDVLEASDVGGGSPSPSDLTLKVLNQVL